VKIGFPVNGFPKKFLFNKKPEITINLSLRLHHRRRGGASHQTTKPAKMAKSALETIIFD